MTQPQSPTASESDLVRSFSLAQAAFDNELKTTEQAKVSTENGFKLSKRFALGLKLIAFFGGLAILVGLGDGVTRCFGILVAVAVGIDGIFLNHAKLMAREQAVDAYEVLLERITNRFQNEHLPLVQIQSSQPDEFKKRMIVMLTSLRNELFKTRQEIAKALKAVNREALKTLSLQVPIQGIPNVPASAQPPTPPVTTAS